ncbi:MAG: hypothetical protein ABJL67_09675 [Sulfitobacter sp.]
MKTYETDVEINAPIEVVWRSLTQEMPKSPQAFGILQLEGQIQTGAKIKLRSEVAPERAFVLKVDVFQAPNEMVWRGGMPFGLFTGRRRFSLTADGRMCRFQMKEVFSGMMSGMITKSMPDLTPSFEKFTATLKFMAEKQ